MSKMDDLDLLSQNVAEGGDITMFPYMHPGITAATVVGTLAGTVLTSAVTVIAARHFAKQIKEKKQEGDRADEEI